MAVTDEARLDRIALGNPWNTPHQATFNDDRRMQISQIENGVEPKRQAERGMREASVGTVHSPGLDLNVHWLGYTGINHAQ